MITIKDVARRASVSFTTVSHVINKTRPVSTETIEKVNAAIAELGYLPSHVGRALQSSRTRTIGMIVTTTSNPFFGQVVHGVERACFERGYALIICNTDDVADHLDVYMNTLVSKRVDAVVVMTSNATPEFFATVREQRRVPVVAIDAPPGSVGSLVSDDSVAGGRLVGEFLLGRGYTSIACLSGLEGHPRMRDRIDGVRAVLAVRGLILADRDIVHSSISMAAGQAAAAQLIERPAADRPEVIFALADVLAIGAMHAAREAGLRIPEDLSIVGYDDIEFAAHTFPPLTTVRQPADLIGATAANAALDHLENGTPLPGLIMLTPELVVRETTR